MTTAFVIRLVILLLVFLAWAALMFGALSKVSARARDGNGFLSALGAWARDPAEKKGRGTLYFMTFVLVALIIMQTAIPGA